MNPPMPDPAGAHAVFVLAIALIGWAAWPWPRRRQRPTAPPPRSFRAQPFDDVVMVLEEWPPEAAA